MRLRNGDLPPSRAGWSLHAEGRALAGRYLPDLVYGANDGVITTFAVVCGVVGAALSNQVILILGFANLVADGFSMGASNYLARRSYEDEKRRDERRPAARHGIATLFSFLVVGAVPLLAYLAPMRDDARFPVAVGLTFLTLFTFGAARSIVTKVGWARSGTEMLVVGAAAAVVAYAVGALAAGLTGTS
jgi:VIT1/CCC1 family predicted Fe2+/Mn2+ transporter